MEEKIKKIACPLLNKGSGIQIEIFISFKDIDCNYAPSRILGCPEFNIEDSMCKIKYIDKKLKKCIYTEGFKDFN